MLQCLWGLVDLCVRQLICEKDKSGFWFRRKYSSLTEVNVKTSFVLEDMFSCGISGIAAVKKASQSAGLLSLVFLLHILWQAR